MCEYPEVTMEDQSNTRADAARDLCTAFPSLPRMMVSAHLPLLKRRPEECSRGREYLCALTNAAIVAVVQECHRKDRDVDLDSGLQARLGMKGGRLFTPACQMSFNASYPIIPCSAQ